MTQLSMLDYLLASLGEECGEVQQVVSKSLRFGLLDSNPKHKLAPYNWLILRQELHEVVAIYEMLCDEFDRVEILDRELIEKKKTKVLKWIAHAKSVGRLDND